MLEFKRFDRPYPTVYGVSPATTGSGKRVGIVAVKRKGEWKLCSYAHNRITEPTDQERAWLEALPVEPGTVDQFSRPPEFNN